MTSRHVLHAVSKIWKIHVQRTEYSMLLTLNITREKDFFSYIHSCKARVNLSQLWNKFHIQRQTIAYPLFNWIYFLIVLVFVTQMSEITSSVSMRHHSTNKHLLFLYMNWYQHVFDEVTNTCHLTTLYNKSHTINMDKRIHCWLSKVISCKCFTVGSEWLNIRPCCVNYLNFQGILLIISSVLCISIIMSLFKMNL